MLNQVLLGRYAYFACSFIMHYRIKMLGLLHGSCRRCVLSNPFLLQCSNDLTTGVRATAQMMTATRTTITDSVLLANAVVASHLLPAVRSRLPTARGESLYCLHTQMM